MIQTTVRMPDTLYSRLKKEAKERGISVNGLIMIMLHDNMEKQKEKT